MHLHPQKYLEKAQEMLKNGASANDAGKILQEVEDIIKAKTRGIEMLKKMGRQPEKSVIENKVTLEKAREILQRLC